MMETPAGREREKLTSILLDASDKEGVEIALISMLGTKHAREIRRVMLANGGGNPTIRDYCAELDVASLRKVARMVDSK